MEQKNKRQGKNKGFSLVELIVVMAIMAILVGAIAPQVIKYVEKARESRDIQVAGNLLTAFTTTIGSSDETVGTFSINSITQDQVDYNKIKSEVQSLCGFSTDTEIHNVLKSKKGKNGWSDSASGFTFSYDSSTDKITIKLGDISVTNK